MKLLVVSDNHGDRRILEQLTATYQKQVDGLIHVGDSEMSADDELFLKMPSVLGNNDWGQNFPEKRLLELEDERILWTHGHLYGVNFGLTNLELLAKERNASIIAYGHTHQLAVTMEAGRLYLNPGSISLPRGEYSYLGGTYAIVTVDQQHYAVQFYNRNLEPVEGLYFQYQRK